MNTKIPFIFFGTPDFAVIILEELARAGYMPACIVTAPDKPQGRGLKHTPPPVKQWAITQNIPVLQPEKITNESIQQLLKYKADLAIVAAYGFILPESLLSSFKNGILNVHPSLLPRYRGSSPITTPLINGDDSTGISIMLLDTEMDHGPIIAQKDIPLTETITATELSNHLAHEGGKLLVEIIPAWVNGTKVATPQDHTQATYTKKVKKIDGELTDALSPIEKYRHFRAYQGWPGVYMIHPKAGRVKVTDAELQDTNFIIKKVIPEGKREMSYEEFLRGYEK